MILTVLLLVNEKSLLVFAEIITNTLKIFVNVTLHQYCKAFIKNLQNAMFRKINF